MSDIRIFKTQGDPKEIKLSRVPIEKNVQSLIEKNMELFFNVTFLKTEWTIDGGRRMDSIGIDENNSPVIFEYKRGVDENVMSQGLFYLDWLVSHQADYQILVQNELGIKRASEIDWTMPTVVCIAGDFSAYDLHAVNQMPGNIRLVKYSVSNDGLIVFEHLNQISKNQPKPNIHNGEKRDEKSFEDTLKTLPQNMIDLYDDVRNYIETLGDDVNWSIQKKYIAFKKVGNIACIVPTKQALKVYVKNRNMDEFDFEEGFTEDYREKGHWATGCDLQIKIANHDDFAKAKEILRKAYEEN